MTRICNRIIILFACALLIGGVFSFEEKRAFAQDMKEIGTLARAQAVTVDGRGNVYVAGYSYSSSSDMDFLTLKYDGSGRLLWAVRYDGPAGSSDYASAVKVDEKGCVYTAGHSNGRGTSLDMAVVKYDENGREMWTYRYDGPSHRDDYVQSMAVDPSGNIFVTGYSFGSGTEHDFVTLKLSPAGRKLWADRYNSTMNRDDSACGLSLYPGGSIVITGTDRVRETSYDFLTIRYDEKGKRIWQARYSSPGNEYDTARALAVGDDGAVYVTGYSYRREAEYDIVTLKYDSEGKQVWLAEYNGPYGRMDTACCLAVGRDGSVYVAGKSLSEDSAFDICLLKYDKAGRQVWAERYNGSGNGADSAVAVAVNHDGNIVVTGYSLGAGTSRDMVILKYTPDGSLLWEGRWNGPASKEDRPVSMALDSGGNICIVGYSIGEDDTFDCLTLKYGAEGQLLWVSRWPENKQID